MQKQMPPLRALVAFEAAVRHSSFKDAAKELHITPGAVSQQVQKLEQWLGYTLFIREIRQLTVTDRGLAYFNQISPALEQINTASTALRIDKSNSVCLSLSQTLAAKWLGPRLGDFVSQHPDIEVHISASNTPVNFNQENVDLAIRHFDGKDPDLDAALVHNDEVRLFCSANYRDRYSLQQPDQLRGTTLISTNLCPFWNAWLAQCSDITTDEVLRLASLHFDQPLLAIDAAKRDQGVVLSNTLLVQDELKQGTLVEPFQQHLQVDKSYYLVHPKRQALSPAAQALKTWLLGQFSTSETNT